jgi:hypothetical protein
VAVLRWVLVGWSVGWQVGVMECRLLDALYGFLLSTSHVTNAAGFFLLVSGCVESAFYVTCVLPASTRDCFVR